MEIFNENLIIGDCPLVILNILSFLVIDGDEIMSSEDLYGKIGNRVYPLFNAININRLLLVCMRPIKHVFIPIWRDGMSPLMFNKQALYYYDNFYQLRRNMNNQKVIIKYLYCEHNAPNHYSGYEVRNARITHLTLSNTIHTTLNADNLYTCFSSEEMMFKNSEITHLSYVLDKCAMMPGGFILRFNTDRRKTRETAEVVVNRTFPVGQIREIGPYLCNLYKQVESHREKWRKMGDGCYYCILSDFDEKH